MNFSNQKCEHREINQIVKEIIKQNQMCGEQIMLHVIKYWP